jgi:hypothetical protein
MQIVISTRLSVISTRTRLVSTRRVRFPHAECDFTRKVWFPLTRENMRVNMTLTSVIHAECNFHTHCDFDMHDCDYDTHDCDFKTRKSDFYTYDCDFDTYECDNDTHECHYDTHECDYNTLECGFNTQKIDFCTQSTFSTRSVVLHAECGSHTQCTCK